MNTVVIKEYDSAAEAYIDKGLLNDNGIDAEVNGEFASGVHPGLPLIAPVTIMVMENNEEAAKKLLEIE